MANTKKTPTEKLIDELKNRFTEYNVGEKPLVFKLKKDRNHLMISSKATVHRDGGVVQLRYSKSFDHPFLEEQNPQIEAIISSIEFEDGLLRVGKGDVCLQKFLIASPNFEKLYFVEDKQKEAEDELNRYEMLDEIREFIAKSEDYEIKSVLAEFKKYSDVQKYSKPEANIALRRLAEDVPEKVKEAIDSKDRRLKYKFLTAVDAQILFIDNKENLVRWADTKDIAFSFTPGRRPADEFMKFISKPEGEELKTMLKEKMQG